MFSPLAGWILIGISIVVGIVWARPPRWITQRGTTARTWVFIVAICVLALGIALINGGLVDQGLVGG
jgi:uncharacterized membrane protein YraQ (UPF0718 family)